MKSPQRACAVPDTDLNLRVIRLNMKELERFALKILENDCPVRGLSEYLKKTSISAYNEDQVQDLINLLEIHEDEIRNLRRTAKLKLSHFRRARNQ